MMKSAVMIIAAAVCALPAGGAELALPREARLEMSRGIPGSWRQWGTLPLAYAAARRSFGLALRKQGWRKLRTVELDPVRWKSLELWGRGSEQILLQYWREDTALTGFAWGELKEEKKTRS